MKAVIYNVVVRNQVVATLSAASSREVRQLKREQWFLDELASKKNQDGNPLCNDATEINFQLAEPVHVAWYNAALKDALQTAAHEEGDVFIAYRNADTIVKEET